MYFGSDYNLPFAIKVVSMEYLVRVNTSYIHAPLLDPDYVLAYNVDMSDVPVLVYMDLQDDVSFFGNYINFCFST